MKKALITAVALGLLMGTPSVNSAPVLTERQVKIKKIAREIGNKTCTNKMCFGKTLQSIAFSESTYGQNIISGHRAEINIKKVHVKVSKNKNFTINGVKYTWDKLRKKSLGPFQIRLKTAKEIISKTNMTRYNYLLENDVELAKKLLTDASFSATIAANYLRYNYNIGIRRGVSNPWRFTVSRYNGGNSNKAYIDTIARNLTH